MLFSIPNLFALIINYHAGKLEEASCEVAGIQRLEV